MQIQNKKDITLSSATGTPTVVRKGNIAKWDSAANYQITPATSGYQQIGQGLKLVSTGRPVRIRLDFGTQIFDGVIQQVAAAQSDIGIDKYINGVLASTVSKSIRSVTNLLVKQYANGNINDYIGTQQAGSINIVDDSSGTPVDGDIVEYRAKCLNQYFTYSVGATNVKHDISILSFEIEEVI